MQLYAYWKASKREFCLDTEAVCAVIYNIRGRNAGPEIRDGGSRISCRQLGRTVYGLLELDMRQYVQVQGGQRPECESCS